MRHPHDKAESRFNTDTGISKEDEERYKKIVLENEELQQKIAQVRMTNDIYIRSMVPINSLFLFCAARYISTEGGQNPNIETTISWARPAKKWHAIRFTTSAFATANKWYDELIESIRIKSR